MVVLEEGRHYGANSLSYSSLSDTTHNTPNSVLYPKPYIALYEVFTPVSANPSPTSPLQHGCVQVAPPLLVAGLTPYTTTTSRQSPAFRRPAERAEKGGQETGRDGRRGDHGQDSLCHARRHRAVGVVQQSSHNAGAAH